MSVADESGRFLEGYGALTGKSAGDVADLVAKHLREQGFLIGTEPYTHSYPHCWRCGRELVYRLVDGSSGIAIWEAAPVPTLPAWARSLDSRRSLLTLNT